jgi:hypothetical protein
MIVRLWNLQPYSFVNVTQSPILYFNSSLFAGVCKNRPSEIASLIAWAWVFMGIVFYLVGFAVLGGAIAIASDRVVVVTCW